MARLLRISIVFALFLGTAAAQRSSGRGSVGQRDGAQSLGGKGTIANQRETDSFAARLQKSNSIHAGGVSARFDKRGLVSLLDPNLKLDWEFTKDEFAVTLGGQSYDSASLPLPERKNEASSMTFSYAAGPYQLDVVYDGTSTGRFVRKRIVIRAGSPGKFKIDEITPFRNTLSDKVQGSVPISRPRKDLGTLDYGGFLHFEKSHGLLVAAQNPFLTFQRDGQNFSISYKPDMEWDMAWGPFESDPGILAPYLLTDRMVPEKMLPEWSMAAIDETPLLDEAEVQAFSDAVRASMLQKPGHPLNLMVGWCANDYQIDIATAEGRAEYKRIIDMAANLGAEHVLFAPANSDVSRREESRDDWKWEHTLWLGLGQKIRKNEWDPRIGPIPASVQEMLDYARTKKVGLLAYVYPILGFTQKPEWLLGGNGTRANLGVHSFQEWLIGALEGFYRHTGITGYSFDHTFLNLEGTSKYAQWWGWRRVMETLRKDIPDIVIDGRQAYQNYGPWGWLAGSYPHPTSTDEQPESFVSFPDLKLDRVSADRERYTAYRYRNYEFTPTELMPGFITHQTGRNDDTGHMPATGETLTPFRQRDWDYLGWRYSLLSSIAVAGFNNVIDMIPARDPEEFKLFSETDRKWFLKWIDWTDINKGYLWRTKTILGQPAIGKVDGTSAMLPDGGFVFLFNPNGRAMGASFDLDESIGLSTKGKYTIRELYPQEGRLVGKPGEAIWNLGDTFTRQMDGGSAVVLEIETYESSREIRLYNSPGSATLDGRTLRLTDVEGERGTSETLLVQGASGKVDTVKAGDVRLDFRAVKSGLIEIPVKFVV